MYLRIIAILALLPACAYQTALKRGDEAAASNNWNSAYAAYSFAHTTKPGTRTEAAMEAALNGKLDAALSALEMGVFESAFERIDEAQSLAPDAPRIAQARAQAEATLDAALPSRTSGDDIQAAYAFAAVAKRLHPRSAVVEDTLAMLRDRVIKSAREKQNERDWEGAREATALILEYEPERRTNTQALDDEIVADWVANLVKRATSSGRNRPGLAAALYARAYEVGGDEAILKRAREYYQAAGDQAPRAVFVDSEGSGGRHWTVRKNLRAAVADRPGTRRGYSSKYDLQAKIYTGGESCRETSEKERQSKDYIAGTRDIPNPEHAKVSAEVKSAKTENKAAGSALASIERSHEAARLKLDTLESEHNATNKVHQTAASTLEATRKQHIGSQTVHDDAAKEHQTLVANGNVELAASAKERLDEASGIFQEWVAKLEVDTKEAQKARLAFEAADGALVPHKATFQELSAQLDTSRKRATEAEKELSTQTAALHITPQTLPEKIKDTLFYDKVTWTLECSVSATVYFAPGWKTDLKRKQRLESKQSTTDTAQKGHSMAQVTDDPKMYPKSKDEIVAGLNVDAHKQLARATDAFIAEYFTKTASAALAQEADTDSATHTLLTLLSGAPTRLDDSTQKAAIDYVLKSQELHDFSLLDPTYSASPAEAKVAGSEPEPQAKQ